MTRMEVAMFLFGASAALFVRSGLSALLRYWCHRRPLNRVMREHVRSCISADVKPFWPE